jgi:hypothetical protein
VDEIAGYENALVKIQAQAAKEKQQGDAVPGHKLLQMLLPRRERRKLKGDRF